MLMVKDKATGKLRPESEVWQEALDRLTPEQRAEMGRKLSLGLQEQKRKDGLKTNPK